MRLYQGGDRFCLTREILALYGHNNIMLEVAGVDVVVRKGGPDANVVLKVDRPHRLGCSGIADLEEMVLKGIVNILNIGTRVVSVNKLK